jgi:hypothetical protein
MSIPMTTKLVAGIVQVQDSYRVAETALQFFSYARGGIQSR